MADDKIKIEKETSREFSRESKLDTEAKKVSRVESKPPKTEAQHEEELSRAFDSKPVDLTKAPAAAKTENGPISGNPENEPSSTPADEFNPAPEDQGESGGGTSAGPGAPSAPPSKSQTEEEPTAEQEEKPEQEEEDRRPKKEEEPKEKEKDKKPEEEKEPGEGEEGKKEGEEGEPGEAAEEEPGFGEPVGEGEEAGEAGAEGAGEAGAEGAAETGAEGAAEGGAETAAGEASAAGTAEAGAGAAEAGAAGAEAAGAAGAEAAGAAAAEGAVAAGAEAGAGAAVAGAWPLILAIVIVILCIFAFGMVSAWALPGRLGKSAPQYASPSATNVNEVVKATQTPTDVKGYNSIWMEKKDIDYINQGKIDRRLIDSINYLDGKHKYLKISHFLTEYENMSNNPEGNQLSQNISAHHNGLAADITTIDFVYKVFEESEECAAATNGLGGDVVYYNDENKELLRLKCRGDIFDMAGNNTVWNGKPATAIPINITYQDAKPDNPHAGNLPDPGLSLTGVDKEVYDLVLQPEARRKVHQVIKELLDYPNTTSDWRQNRVSQLITFSEERDVLPFINDGTLDKIYGTNRPNNYGLFSMEEAWQNIHIGF